MVNKYKIKNHLVVLSGTATETDYTDTFIVIRNGTKVIGCSFKQCKVFIESGANQSTFNRCNFGSKQDLVPIQDADVFIKNFTKGEVE